MLGLELDEHLGEAVDRARRQAGLGSQRWQRVIGAEDEAGAVDEVERLGVSHGRREPSTLDGPHEGRAGPNTSASAQKTTARFLCYLSLGHEWSDRKIRRFA